MVEVSVSPELKLILRSKPPWKERGRALYTKTRPRGRKSSLWQRNRKKAQLRQTSLETGPGRLSLPEPGEDSAFCP